MKSYVFDGVEVKKTGRTAERKIAIPGGKERVLEQIEITPVDEDLDWKKWVRPEELFEIVEINHSDPAQLPEPRRTPPMPKIQPPKSP